MDWKEAARRLESRLDLSRIPGSVAERLDALHTVYVACSGGADSVFALLLLRAYFARRERAVALRVLHFDHALRGEASALDAKFVGEMSEGLRIPFQVAKARWPEGLESVNEARAREARLAFFRDASGAALSDPTWIATGHHGDDVVETMLMRLSRGAGLQGLAAPREISDAGNGLVFLRPALTWGRDEIRALLQDCGIPWREDETNESDVNYRARLRKGAVPAWEKASDRLIRKGVGRSRRMLAEDAEALGWAADHFWELAWDESQGALRRAVVAGLPPGIQRRVLFKLPGAGAVAAEAMDLALDAMSAGEDLTLEVENGIFYDFTPDWLVIRKTDGERRFFGWEAFALPLGTVAYLPDGGRLSGERIAVDEALRENVISGSNDDGRIVYLDAEGNSACRLWVRTRAPGDAFKPLGKSSPKKLKKLFIERKIERSERERLPVFESEAYGILWVPGLPPNADCKLGLGSRTALRLTYDR